MTCKNCGAQINEGSKFCEVCGTAYDENQSVINENDSKIETAPVEVNEENTTATQVEKCCENCGLPVEEGSAFCPQCGARYLEEVEKISNFCINCGASVEDGERFCSVCGADTIGDNKKPIIKNILSVFKQKKAILIAGIILLASVVAFAAPVIKNSVVRAFTSPEDYFKYVVNHNFENVAEEVTTVYSTALNKDGENMAGEAEITMFAGEGLESLVDDLGGGYAWNYIDWFESAKITGYANRYKDNENGSIGFELNGEKILTYEIFADAKKLDFYFGCPELNSKYVNIDLSFLEEELYYYEGYFEDMKKLVDALPDEKITEKLLCRYMECLISGVEEVDETNTTIEASGCSQKVTALSTEISGEVVQRSLINTLKTVKDDKEIEEIVKEICEIEGLDADYNDFVDAVDEALEELEDLDEDDLYFDELDLTLYVNNRGEIVGVELKNGSFKLETYTTRSGSKFGSYTKLKIGVASLEIEGNGKKNGDKVTGEYVCEVSGVELFSVSLEKLNIEKLKEGAINGKITLTVSDDIKELIGSTGKALSDVSVVIEGKSKSAENIDQKIIFEYDGEECLKIETKADEKSAKKIEMPKNSVKIEDADDMEEWLEDVDFDEIIDALEKADVPDILIYALRGEMY